MSRAIRSSDPGAERTVANLLPRDGEAYLIERALAPAIADRALAELIETTDWRQEHALLFGKSIPLPRLTAWYGEHGYGYSGIHHQPAPFPAAVLGLKSVIERLTDSRFNSVLINLYRDGRDSMGWHSDDEDVLGPEPEIASLSLGASRRFHLRHRQGHGRIGIDLGHGSCLVMKGRCQACWRHQLPKTAKDVGPRVNLTFRSIRP